MNNFKVAQVIILPTTDISILGIYQNKLRHTIGNWNVVSSQHMYIISDDKLKEGDWYFSLESRTVYLKGKDEEIFYKHFTYFCKKIIATTDPALINKRLMTFQDNTTDYAYDIPQPVQQFLDEYVESYNKGVFIAEVLVEYELEYYGLPTWGGTRSTRLKLKVNPKDNIINIKQLKPNKI